MNIGLIILIVEYISYGGCYSRSNKTIASGVSQKECIARCISTGRVACTYYEKSGDCVQHDKTYRRVKLNEAQANLKPGEDDRICIKPRVLCTSARERERERECKIECINDYDCPHECEKECGYDRECKRDCERDCEGECEHECQRECERERA